MLFCDGHARWKKEVSLRFSDFGASPTSASALCRGALVTTADLGGNDGVRCSAAF